MNKEYRKNCLIIDELSEIQDGNAVENTTEPQKAVGEQVQNSDEEGKACGPNRDHTKRYSLEFKKMIVRLHTEQKRTFNSLTEEFGVSKATITKWCSDARYANYAQVTAKEKELENINIEYVKLKEENDFLKKILIMLFGKGVGELA